MSYIFNFSSDQQLVEWFNFRYQITGFNTRCVKIGFRTVSHISINLNLLSLIMAKMCDSSKMVWGQPNKEVKQSCLLRIVQE